MHVKEGKFVAPSGYKGYHGTWSKNLASILSNGLRGPDDWEGEYSVCLTEEPDIAVDFGDVTIEADLSGLEVYVFWDQGDDSIGDEEDGSAGCWEIQVEGSIPPERLRVWEI